MSDSLQHYGLYPMMLLSVGFPRQKYWSGLPCPPPGDLPNPSIEPMSLMSPTLAGGYFTTKATKESGEPSKCSLCISCPLQGRRAKSKRAGRIQHFPRRTSSCCLWGLAPRSPRLSPGPCWHRLSEGLVKQEEVPTRTTRKKNPTQGAEWKNLWLINSPSSIEINVPSTAHTKAWSTPLD